MDKTITKEKYEDTKQIVIKILSFIKIKLYKLLLTHLFNKHLFSIPY